MRGFLSSVSDILTEQQYYGVLSISMKRVPMVGVKSLGTYNDP
jgi:hypothetical protein